VTADLIPLTLIVIGWFGAVVFALASRKPSQGRPQHPSHPTERIRRLL